jgi:hypothetical protein
MANYYKYLREDQAADILQHLTRQLAANGLAEVLENLQESLALIGPPPLERTDDTPYEEYPSTSRALLGYYLNGAIDYLENISSHNYQVILAGINATLSPEGRELEEIRLRYTPLGSETAPPREESLATLPDYFAVINSLKKTRQQLDDYATETQI